VITIAGWLSAVSEASAVNKSSGAGQDRSTTKGEEQGVLESGCSPAAGGRGGDGDRAGGTAGRRARPHRL